MKESMKESSPLLVEKNSPGGNKTTRLFIPPDDYEYDKYTTFYISLSLVYCFIVCGLMTVALGATLEDLARNVGHEATDIGTIYVARGVGSVVGSILSFYVFEHCNAVMALIVNDFAIAVVSLFMPFISNLWTLHVAYMLVGGITSILQAGSMLLLRKVHKEKAGPWLGAFGASFVSAGIMVPAVQLLVPDLLWQYVLFTLAVVCGACWLLSLPSIREDINSVTSHTLADVGEMEEGSSNGKVNDDPTTHPPHFRAEMVVGAMVFFAIGGGDSLTFYLETYVDSNGSLQGCNKEVLLLFFFVFATVGDVLGILGQLDVTDKMLSLQTGLIFLTGATAMFIVIMNPVSHVALWIGVCIFGLCNAPSISYCFNIANRLSYPSATSTAMIMFGLSLGISLMPYFTSVVWETFDAPLALMYVGCLCSIVPIFLLYLAPSFSYLKGTHNFITFF